MVQFIIISFDPGFQHLAYVISVVHVNTQSNTVTFNHMKAGILACCKPGDTMEMMSENVAKVLRPVLLPYLQLTTGFTASGKRLGIGSSASPPTMIALIEQGVNSQSFAFHSQNWQIQLRFLEITLYNVLRWGFGSKTNVVMIPATYIKQWFNSSTPTYSGNKQEGMKVARNIIDFYFPKAEDRIKLQNIIIPNNNISDSHMTDAFNQLMYYLESTLLPAVIHGDDAHALTGYSNPQWKYYLQSYYATNPNVVYSD